MTAEYQRYWDEHWTNSKKDFFEKYKESSNNASVTIDDNSNFTSKNIGILNNEIHKGDNIKVNRAMVLEELQYLMSDPSQYIRDLESHLIYKHDESSFPIPVPYCASISMYPFLLNGVKGLGGLSASPQNIDSFCGIYINLINTLVSQFAGAVATPEFFVCFDYFAKKKWGKNYWKNADAYSISNMVFAGDGDTTTQYNTIHQQIHQYFQQIVYSINQPSASRGLQSAFVNFSYFDKPFFEGMFGEFVFPDGKRPEWDSLSWLQRDFMTWFNEERTRCMMTFPVESFALVYRDGHFEDEDSACFVAAEYAAGHSFFTYISDTVDSLSSCCFQGDEVIKIYDKNNNIINTTIHDFVNYNNSQIDPDGNQKMKEKYYIDSYNLNGQLEKTKITGTLKKEHTGAMYKIYIDDNNFITVTPEHILMVKDSNQNIIAIKAEDLIKNPSDYELVVE